MERTHIVIAGFAACALLVAGCGNSKRSSSTVTAPSTASPTTSSSALGFTTLDRGIQSGAPAAIASSVTAETITDAGTFGTFWTDHTSATLTPPAAPAVDFDKETVVGLFMGQQPSAGYGIEVVSVAAVGSNSVEVRYQTTQPSGTSASVVTSPFHIITINRPRVSVSIAAVGSNANPGGTTPPVVRLDKAHGELVLVSAQAPASGEVLAFLEDGQQDAREIVDPSALVAKGARVGTNLTLDADVDPNLGGKTTLAEAIRVASYTLDDVAKFGRLLQTASLPPITMFMANDGRGYRITGAKAKQLEQQVKSGRPVFVSGTLATQGTSTLLAVSSFRHTTEVRLGARGGLLAYDELFNVQDLTRTGSYRFHATYGRWFPAENNRFGQGRIRPTDRAELERLVAAAKLRTQPGAFTGPPIMDAPLVTLYLSDKDGDVAIKLGWGATLPADLEALVNKLKALKKVPTFRTLNRGQYSGFSQASLRIAKTSGSYGMLWRQAYGSLTPKQVTFPKEIVLGAYMGRMNGGGHAITIEHMEKLGDDLHVTIRRDYPRPGTPQTLNLPTPHHTVAIDTTGVKGSLFVDGVRYSLRRLPLLPRPRLPLKALPKPLPRPLPRPLPPIGPRPTPGPIGPIGPRPIPRPLPIPRPRPI